MRLFASLISQLSRAISKEERGNSTPLPSGGLIRTRTVERYETAMKGKGPLTKSEVADAVGVTKTGCLSSLERLADTGLVRKTVSLTPGGAQIVTYEWLGRKEEQ